MKLKSVLVVGLPLLLAGSVAFGMMTAQPIGEAGDPAEVVFVCRNGVSMSVWATAYFNRVAAERGLRARAVARAAIPSYTDVPFNMVFALAVDGFRLDGYRPHVVSPEDIRDAMRIVVVRATDDTILPPDVQAKQRDSEVWDGFPAMRDRYFPARAALRARVEDLVERLAAKSQ